ncbi:MAG: eCIS core domain-containing protein [Gammaproteobacteria bacterium]
MNNIKNDRQPLPQSLRAFFEPRFGYDFSQVMVHTGAQAANFARAVNARAFTVGNDIVFGAGQYRPNTPAGHKLIAHELVHTLQQSPSDRRLQRLVFCEPARMSMISCPPRKRGEVRRAKRDPMIVNEIVQPAKGLLVGNFAVGKAAIKPGFKDDLVWQNYVSRMEANPHHRYEILGFTDCQGDESTNIDLRKQRAEAVKKALPEAVRAQVLKTEAPSVTRCITENSDELERAFNRSALIQQTHTEVEFEAEELEGEKPEFVCGPDVTADIISAISGLRSTFTSFNPTQQEEACEALVSYPIGEVAWDIVELCDKCSPGNAWILNSFPTCATQYTPAKCGAAVQVGDECFFSGSANYVIYGVMFKLCSALDFDTFNLGEALSWIRFYKTKGGLRRADPNLPTAQQWAKAGYTGWPSGSTPSPGDRADCNPLCPLSYTGSAFRVRWCPPQDPDSGCEYR